MQPLRAPVVLGAIVLTALAALALAALPAAAHEHVQVGPYEFSLGWASEPAIEGAPNGLELGIDVDVGNNTTEPVLGAHNSLDATLSFGPYSTPKALEPAFGEPGGYTFDVIPTEVGVYTVRLVGTLNGTAVNISVELDAPVSRSDLEFPGSATTISELNGRIHALEVDRVDSGVITNNRIGALEDDARSLKTTALLAEVLAVAGLLVGVVGIVVARKAKGAPPKSG